MELCGFSESTMKRYRNKWEVFSSVDDKVKPFILLLSHKQISKILKNSEIKELIYSANEVTYEDLLSIVEEEKNKKLIEQPSEILFSPEDFNVENFVSMIHNTDKMTEDKKKRFYKLLGEITKLMTYLLPNKSLMLGRGIGLKALDGTIENADGGLIKNQAISMLAEKKGVAVNSGTIETELTGLMALDGGTATNNGIIKAWVNEKEGRKGEAGIGLHAYSFDGPETVITNSETGIVYGSVKSEGQNAKVINNGTIYGTEIKVETEANKEWRVIGGADYTNIEANPSNLSGYDTDIKSVFVGADKEINSNHRLGGVLNVGTLESDFDMNNARREDTFVQGNIYSIYNYNGIQFINNFFLGLSEGDLERDLRFGDVEGRQKGDLDTNYLGLNNIVTKKFDFENSIYLKPKAEFNITQLQMGDIKEDGNYGLVVDKQDVTSIEAGFGIEAGKHFDITDTLVGTVKIYGNYLAELSDPYEEMEVKLRRIDYSDTVKLSDYDDEDYKDLGIRFELSNESD